MGPFGAERTSVAQDGPTDLTACIETDSRRGSAAKVLKRWRAGAARRCTMLSLKIWQNERSEGPERPFRYRPLSARSKREAERFSTGLRLGCQRRGHRFGLDTPLFVVSGNTLSRSSGWGRAHCHDEGIELADQKIREVEAVNSSSNW